MNRHSSFWFAAFVIFTFKQQTGWNIVRNKLLLLLQLLWFFYLKCMKQTRSLHISSLLCIVAGSCFTSPVVSLDRGKQHDKISKCTYSRFQMSKSGNLTYNPPHFIYTLTYSRWAQQACEAQSFMLVVVERWMLHWSFRRLKCWFQPQMWGLLFPLDLWRAHIIYLAQIWYLPHGFV